MTHTQVSLVLLKDIEAELILAPSTMRLQPFSVVVVCFLTAQTNSVKVVLNNLPVWAGLTGTGILFSNPFIWIWHSLNNVTVLTCHSLNNVTVQCLAGWCKRIQA